MKSGAKVLSRIADAEQRAFIAQRDARKAERNLIGLNEQIAVKRQELQDIENQKATGLEEIRQIAEKKQKLLGVIENLQSEVSNAQEVLNTAINRQSHFLESSETERKAQIQKLDSVKTHLENINSLIKESEPVAKELLKFVKKNKTAREKYLKQSAKLSKAETKYKAVQSEFKAKLADIKSGKQDLNGLKSYLEDLYGRLASYVSAAKDTLEYINAEMEKNGVPMRFGLPEGQILEIDMFNFDLRK